MDAQRRLEQRGLTQVNGGPQGREMNVEFRQCLTGVELEVFGNEVAFFRLGSSLVIGDYAWVSVANKVMGRSKSSVFKGIKGFLNGAKKLYDNLIVMGLRTQLPR